MAMGIWLPGGGGTDLDVVTASAGDVLAGKVIVGPDGEPLTGTLALSGNASDGQVLSGQTYYNTDAKTKRTGTMPNKEAVNQSLAINGSYTIPEGYHNGNGKVTQSVKTKGAQTFTPGRSNQSIGANQWLSGAQTILGDPNLKPENIKKGVPIFGNVGTHEGYVTSPLNIFNKGAWSNLQTPGITETWKWDSGKYELTDPYIVNENNLIKLYIRARNDSAATQYKCNARLNSTVNLSSYKYLKINASAVGNFQRIYLGVSKNSNLQAFTYDSVYSETTEITGVKVVDISWLSGDYYIYIGFETTLETTMSGEYHIDQIILSNT